MEYERAHKVINLLRHAPKDDIVVMLMCMSLTVLFDMVIAISVGIVLASLLFMRRIARMTHLAPVNVEVPPRSDKHHRGCCNVLR